LNIISAKAEKLREKGINSRMIFARRGMRRDEYVKLGVLAAGQAYAILRGLSHTVFRMDFGLTR